MTAVDGFYRVFFDFLGSVDTPHNLAPSLHVAFAALIVFSCAERTTPFLSLFYVLWLAALAASTVFVHQHHLIDVATGLVLAVSVRRLSPIDPVLKLSPVDA